MPTTNMSSHERAVRFFYSRNPVKQLYSALFYRGQLFQVRLKALRDATDATSDKRAAVRAVLSQIESFGERPPEMEKLHLRTARAIDAQPHLEGF